MKTSLLVLFTTGLFLILTAGSCLQGKHVTGSKNYLTKKVEVGQFNEVKLSGSVNVTYHQGSQNYIEIYGSDNIIPLLETYVDGNTLIIKYKKNVTIWKGKLEVKVFSPELNKLTINGSGDIHFANGIQTKEDISLSINGSGDIKGEKLQMPENDYIHQWIGRCEASTNRKQRMHCQYCRFRRYRSEW